jgi:ketosteroid isomerase-like protein
MKRSACVLLLSGVSFAALAADGPAQIVEAYHKALGGSDPQAVLKFMANDADVFEQGFVDPARDDYAKASLARDMDFAAKTKREVQSQQSSADANLAWVETLTRTSGTYENGKVDLSGAETVILRKDGNDWKIVHVHRSAHETRAPAASKKN